MKIASVSFISFFDNKILSVIVELPYNATWKDAYLLGMQSGELGESDDNMAKWIAELPDDLSDARAELCEGEIDLAIVFYEIPHATAG